MCWRYLKSSVITCCLAACGAVFTASVLAFPGPDASLLHTLSPGQCAPPPKAGYHGPLAAGWDAYKPYVRACPLAMSNASTKLWLLTVFAQPYLHDHPGETAWPNFPRPRLVTADGHCVARLPELFPFDEPRSLHLRYGPSVDGMPVEIRVYVSNPAAGGDYTLPVLRWSPAQRAYIAQNDTDEYAKGDMRCRHP